jgi:putative transcriptional regulator
MSKDFLSDINFNHNFNDKHDGYYEGQLLIATPYMRGEIFSGSVIYVFAHNAGGAMGVIINKPLEMVHYASLFQQLSIDISKHNQDLTIYHGGPVEENRGFVLHSAEYELEDTLCNDSGINVTASINILRDIATNKGPTKALLAIGYAGWSAGQLEAEIESNLWLTVPASPEIIFNSADNSKYNMTEKLLGIEMFRMSPMAGHA